MKIYFGFMSHLNKEISSVIYLLLFLSIGIGSTIPIDKSDIQYGEEKLTDGVPTPSHYSNSNDNGKEPTQSLPSITSDMSPQFPEVHVTSEVRTVSLQISEDGMPIITGIVNPVVFAKEQRQGTFFEPTEVEAPVYTPTSTSLVNNSNNVDNLVTARTLAIRQPIYANHSSNHQRVSASHVDAREGNQEQVSSNMKNVASAKEVSNIEISRKPKRISSSANIKDYTNKEFLLKNSRYGEEEVPLSFLGESDTEEVLFGKEIVLTKRQQKKNNENVSTIRLDGGSGRINRTNTIESPVKKKNNTSLEQNDKLAIDDLEVSEVAELKTRMEKQPDSNIPAMSPQNQDDSLSFWKSRSDFKKDTTPPEDRVFTVEKIHKEGIQQFMLDSKDNKFPKHISEHLLDTNINNGNTEDGFEDINPEEQTGIDESSIYIDLMEATSLDKQVPRAILKSQEKILLKASQENFSPSEAVNIHEEAEIIPSNISRRNASETDKPELQSKVESISSHMVQGVAKSRSLEPYDELFNPDPSISPNEQISSPISEQLDRDLAPGCVAAIVLGVLLCALAAMGSLAFVVYNRHSGIRPKMFSSDRSCANSDSGGYFDDQCRVAYLNSQSDVSKGTPEDLVSLDNDSFLNSLESMTIQNLWTDSIRHTKL